MIWKCTRFALLAAMVLASAALIARANEDDKKTEDKKTEKKTEDKKTEKKTEDK